MRKGGQGLASSCSPSPTIKSTKIKDEVPCLLGCRDKASSSKAPPGSGFFLFCLFAGPSGMVGSWEQDVRARMFAQHLCPSGQIRMLAEGRATPGMQQPRLLYRSPYQKGPQPHDSQAISYRSFFTTLCPGGSWLGVCGAPALARRGLGNSGHLSSLRQRTA